jgi:ubiquinone/menaquinone biosynthesis C-methylase UbiE
MTKLSKVKVNNYWNNLIKDPEIDGVCAFGGGNAIERYYRSYFEKRNFIKFFSKKQKPNLLEVGCGSGRWAFALSKYLTHYTGIDISKISIDTAIKSCQSKNINNCDFYNIHTLEFNTNQKFDIIYFGGVTQYMEDDEFSNAVFHLKKFLKPCGIFIDRSTVSLEISRNFINKNDYFAIYRTESEITDIFKNANFKKVRSQNSYQFLRVGKLARYMNYPPRLNILRKTPFITYHMLYAITELANLLKPKVFYENGIGYFTHKFQVFK